MHIIIKILIHIDVIIPEIHINKLSCTQYKVKRGERVTITWNSQNVKHVAISGQTGTFLASGTKDLVIDQNKRLCITFYGDNGKEQTRYINIKIRKSNGCLILLLIFILMVLLAILVGKLYPEIYKHEIVRQIVTIVTRFLNQHGIHF